MSGVPNTDQAELWNGELGRSWVQQQERYETMLRPFLSPLLAAADVRPADRVLDVGCGCGTTTLAAAELAGAGHVLGVDLSEPMLEVAQARAADAGQASVHFLRADAQQADLGAGGAFDVVLSRFGVMFFDEPGAAFANLAASARPRGRLAFVCWQEMARNAQRMLPLQALASVVPLPEDAPTPAAFSLADPATVHRVLSAAGWRDVTVSALHEPLLLGADADDATRFMLGQPASRALLADADEGTATAAAAALREALQPFQAATGVWLGSAAWLVTAHR